MKNITKLEKFMLIVMMKKVIEYIYMFVLSVNFEEYIIECQT